MKYRYDLLNEEHEARLADALMEIKQEYEFKGFSANMLYVYGAPYLLVGIFKGKGLCAPGLEFSAKLYKSLIDCQIAQRILLWRLFGGGCQELLPGGQLGEVFDLVEPKPEHAKAEERESHPTWVIGTRWDDLTPAEQDDLREHYDRMTGEGD